MLAYMFYVLESTNKRILPGQTCSKYIFILSVPFHNDNFDPLSYSKIAKTFLLVVVLTFHERRLFILSCLSIFLIFFQSIFLSIFIVSSLLQLFLSCHCYVIWIDGSVKVSICFMPMQEPGRVAQSVGHLTRKSEVLGLDTRAGHILSFHLPLIQEEQLPVTGESMCTKYWLTA